MVLCGVVGVLALYIVYGAPPTQPFASLSARVSLALGASSGDEGAAAAAEEEAREAAEALPVTKETVLARKAKEKKKAKQEDR